MNLSSAFWSWICLVVLLGLGACAQELSPTGGPRDEIPPKVVKTSPRNESLNQNNGTVKFFFDEPIRKPDATKDIFISPLVSRPDVILSDNGKRLTVKIEDDLRPQTTYVITLNGIKDYRESNQIESPYSLAFSTGDQLDSLELAGNIVDPSGKAVEEMLVLLFDADSVPGHDIWNRRPAYLSRTDARGEFRFRFLRGGTYRVFGVQDADQSNTYNSPQERVAIPLDSLLTLAGDTSALTVAPDSLIPAAADSLEPISVPEDSLMTDSLSGDSIRTDSVAIPEREPDATVTLTAFLPDEDPPRFRSPLWLGDSLLSITFDEYLDLGETQIYATDTSRLDTFPVTEWALLPGEEPQLWLEVPGREYWDLHLFSIQDSLGNGQDSIMRITPTRFKAPEKPLVVTPTLKLTLPAWEFLPFRPLSEADRGYFTLTDTARSDSLRQRFDLTWETRGLWQRIRPIGKGTQDLPLVLRVAGEFFYGQDSNAVDTTFLYPVKWLKTDGYGTLSGRVVPDTSYSGPLVMELRGPGQEGIARTFTEETFAFVRLLPGEYRFRVIYDADGNGVWTPGSLTAFRQPERFKVVPGSITIRANWDFADHVVDLNATEATVAETPEEEVEELTE